ncbi:unnamed protein product [Calypogeia fissa]
MTQKSGLFKGQQKKTTAANRHGKAPHIRKGKQFKPPTKKTEEFEVDKEVSKFINAANERKAATLASKEGAKLRVVPGVEVDASKISRKKSVLKKKA